LTLTPVTQAQVAENVLVQIVLPKIHVFLSTAEKRQVQQIKRQEGSIKCKVD